MKRKDTGGRRRTEEDEGTSLRKERVKEDKKNKGRRKRTQENAGGLRRT